VRVQDPARHRATPGAVEDDVTRPRRASGSRLKGRVVYS
jgi:hypothetical protein